MCERNKRVVETIRKRNNAIIYSYIEPILLKFEQHIMNIDKDRYSLFDSNILRNNKNLAIFSMARIGRSAAVLIYRVYNKKQECNFLLLISMIQCTYLWVLYGIVDFSYMFEYISS